MSSSGAEHQKEVSILTTEYITKFLNLEDVIITNVVVFQSTYPVGGGTTPFGITFLVLSFQSTHPVGGGTGEDLGGFGTAYISIHPPRGGGTIGEVQYYTGLDISIHPPRGGWDAADPTGHPYQQYFNPPTPWGVGRGSTALCEELKIFQSTHPVGGGTFGV